MNAIIKIKVDDRDDRMTLVRILVSSGYKVWIENGGVRRYISTFYVCFENVAEKDVIKDD